MYELRAMSRRAASLPAQAASADGGDEAPSEGAEPPQLAASGGTPWILLAALAVLGLGACAGEAADDLVLGDNVGHVGGHEGDSSGLGVPDGVLHPGTPGELITPPTLERVEVAELPAMPLVRNVRVWHERDAIAGVGVDCVDPEGARVDDLLVLPGEGSVGRRDITELLVVGLVFGSACELTVSLTNELGGYVEETFELQVPMTSEDFPTLDMPVLRRGRQPGWTVLDLSHGSSYLGWELLLDGQMRPRWARRIGSSPSDLHVTRDGLLQPLGITSWGGEVEPLADPGLIDQHGVEPSPFNEGAYFMFVLDDTCAGEPYVVEIRGTEVLQSFCPADWFDNETGGTDWTHINGLDFVDGTHIVLSFRNLYGGSLVGVDWATGEVDWLAVGGEAFEAQHSPESLSNGHFLMFDNGSPVGISEAVEVVMSVNPLTRTATPEVVWRWAHPEGRRQRQSGDADRLPNGNTLISFGAPDDGSQPILYEVTPAGRILMELRGPEGWDTYSADRYTCEADASLPPWACP